MLASLQRGDDLSRVQVVARGNHDCISVRIGQNRVCLRGAALETELVGQVAARKASRRNDGVQSDIGNLRERRDQHT